MRKFYRNFAILLFLLTLFLKGVAGSKTFVECLRDTPSFFSVANPCMDFSMDDLIHLLDLYTSLGGVI